MMFNAEAVSYTHLDVYKRQVLLGEIRSSIEEGYPKQTEKLVQQALSENISPQQILEEAMIPAMRNAGQLYKGNDIYIARILAAARFMRCGLDVLEPYLGTCDTVSYTHLDVYKRQVSYHFIINISNVFYIY